jgi:hypothetical protein
MANVRLAKDQTDELLVELSKFNTYVKMMTEKISRNGGDNIIVNDNINLVTANQAEFYETNSALLRSVRDELNLNRGVRVIRGGRRSRRNNRKNRSTRRSRGGQIIAFDKRADPVYYV